MNRCDFPILNYKLRPKMLDIEKYIASMINPIILNSFAGPNFTQKVIEAVTTSRTDKSIIYSCDCGEYQGNYYKGSICPKCRTKVRKADSIKVNVILEIPYGIQVLHPNVYFVLTEAPALKKYIDYMFDITKPIPDNLKHLIPQQGFVYTSQTFIETITGIIKHITKGRIHPTYQKILEFLHTYQNQLFVSKIPIASTIHTIETQQKNLKIADETIRKLLVAIFDLLSLQFKSRFSPTRLHKVVYIAYKEYIAYLKNLIRNKVQVKKAIARGSIYGNSLFFTLRAVASPIIEPHWGDEVHLPWEGAMELFKYHLINKLNKKHNMSVINAIKHINKHVVKYCPIIDNIFKELIEESPYKGIPCLLNRNPSIKMGSLVLVFITKILFHSKTIHVSDLIIPNLNLDFDGDQPQILLLNETGKRNIESLKYFHPMFQTIGYEEPKINMYIPKNLMLLLNSWYHNHR